MYFWVGVFVVNGVFWCGLGWCVIVWVWEDGFFGVSVLFKLMWNSFRNWFVFDMSGGLRLFRSYVERYDEERFLVRMIWLRIWIYDSVGIMMC